MANAAPAAAMADPAALAAKNPSTRWTSSSLKVLPNQYSSSQAVKRDRPALMQPKAMASQGLLPIRTLQATVPRTTAAATGRRAFGPKAISAPTAMPAAGQNTATPGSARNGNAPLCPPYDLL